MDVADADGQAKPIRTPGRSLDWKWRKAAPVTQLMEHRWVQSKLVSPEETRFLPEEIKVDLVASESKDTRVAERIVMHSGTVQYNAFRNRWVLIAIRNGMVSKTDSLLGEVYCSEAPSPQGPFRRAVRIATHPGQSFYNPCHHPLFDEENGRLIYFEGTYTNSFTNSPATPRYNYNQLMYRLDLANPAVKAAFTP